ncbi:MAG: NADP-dependent isocitrate dehydrogenase, partial [Arcanobacterium sp.]|nr:NADP-dependent isocitrate dehydrogenase [Arcanobacterium sp.]
ESPETEAEKEIRRRYDSVKGSAVNPVLREGNSDRRSPIAVKNFAKANPHSMGTWSEISKTSVATMPADDFRSTEQSVEISSDGVVKLIFRANSGAEKELRSDIPVSVGEIFDIAVMRRKALEEFLATQVKTAKDNGILFSAHLKATMMKVSDPIIFGYVVQAFFPETFKKYGTVLAAAGLDPNNGLGSIFAGLSQLPNGAEIEASFLAELAAGPDLAMVNSDLGITNLHVPSDVIIDASMPAMIRNSGKMWNKDGEAQDTLAVIPDSSYAGVYETVIADCKKNGAFDPRTMGTVPNVGLMAQKAEEYGSHDKTFEIEDDGVVELRSSTGEVLLSIAVSQGDIFRGCQTKDAPIRDWVSLAVRRARISGMPAIFWLDSSRAHDRALIEKVSYYLADEDTEGLDLQILSPAAATQATVDLVRAGKDVISVTGNVLRDYLTDLFPILELGTSAKMLSVVPLMAGGGLFETGAGGSAPKHVQQLISENHLRWDSLGEFLAIAESLRHYARFTGDNRGAILAEALDSATERLLNERKSPSRKVGELDNRGSHFWLALWWAEALTQQKKDSVLSEVFRPVAENLAENCEVIVSELNSVQGTKVDLGGYYHPDLEKLAKVMRPSKTLNQVIDSLSQ